MELQFHPDPACKHVEFHSKNEFEKLVNLVSFIIRRLITMHGHMNVKMDKTI